MALLRLERRQFLAPPVDSRLEERRDVLFHAIVVAEQRRRRVVLMQQDVEAVALVRRLMFGDAVAEERQVSRTVPADRAHRAGAAAVVEEDLRKNRAAVAA